MDWLSKVRNTNHVCLLSPWKKFSALFRVYSEVSTCLSVVTEWHLFNNSKKYGENGEILFFTWFDSYIIWSLQDDFFVIFGGGGFGLLFFFCLGWVFFNYAVWLKHGKEKWSCTSVTLGAHWKQAGSCRQTKPAVPAFSLSRTGRL